VRYSEPPQRNADFQSAVSQVFNLLALPSSDVLEYAERSADYKSAIQQITNLRYVTALATVGTKPEFSRLVGFGPNRIQ